MRAPRARSRLTAIVVSGLAARAAARAFDIAPPGGRTRWQRTNHAGEPISLLEGPAVVTGLVVGEAYQRRLGTAAAVAVIGAVGAYDDLFGATATKGLRGHFEALRRGDVTSGVVKIGAVSASGLSLAAGRSGVVAGLRDGALVAGAANLVNLFDLRPGRALKVSLLSAPLPGTASVVGAGASVLPDDLAGHTMLGDCGANAVGAVVGAAVVRDLPPIARWAALAGVLGLTYVSERVSFSEFIAARPVLDRLDRLGRAW